MGEYFDLGYWKSSLQQLKCVCNFRGASWKLVDMGIYEAAIYRVGLSGPSYPRIV